MQCQQRRGQAPGADGLSLAQCAACNAQCRDGGSVKKNPLRDRVFVPAESRGTARPSGAASPFAPDSCAWASPKTPLTCLLAGCRLHGCTVLACTFTLQGLAWVKSLKRRTAVGCSLLPFLCWGSQRRRDGGGCPACCGAPADIPGLAIGSAAGTAVPLLSASPCCARCRHLSWDFQLCNSGVRRYTALS